LIHSIAAFAHLVKKKKKKTTNFSDNQQTSHLCIIKYCTTNSM